MPPVFADRTTFAKLRASRDLQSSEPLRFAIVEDLNVSDSRLGDVPRQPSDGLSIRREPGSSVIPLLARGEAI